MTLTTLQGDAKEDGSTAPMEEDAKAQADGGELAVQDDASMDDAEASLYRRRMRCCRLGHISISQAWKEHSRPVIAVQRQLLAIVTAPAAPSAECCSCLLLPHLLQRCGCCQACTPHEFLEREHKGSRRRVQAGLHTWP